MATPALSQQQRIGPYVLLQKLGAGGLGEVWKARDTRLNRIVALKFLDGSGESSPARDLLREARAASALNHPNIVTIYDVGLAGETQYLAMEFVSGETLRARLRHAPIALGETLEIAQQVSSALVAAHKGGIVHRDLKPENIMLRDDGFIKIVDFGLAKLLPWSQSTSPVEVAGSDSSNTMTQSGQLVGTFYYMSPEQARGQAVGPPSDIFSFGIVLYEMLSAHHPFRAQSTIDTLTAILQRQPEPISARIPGVPPSVDKLLEAMLQKESSSRVQSGAELAEWLQRIHQAEAAPTATPTAPATPRHLPRWLQAIGALLIVLLLGASAWWMRPGGITRNEAVVAVQSVVVMSFVPAADDQRAGAVADELTAGLDSALNHRGLRVASRSGITANADIRSLASQIGVDAALRGTLRSFGNKLRIHVELVSTRNGFQIWSDTVTVESSDPLAAADSAANQIADAVRDAASKSP